MGAMESFKRIVCPGSTDRGKVFVTIEYKVEPSAGPTMGRGKLSITGVEGPLSNGDCRGSCGQISDTLGRIILGKLREGWNAGMVARLRDYWETWHLNDMHAECEHQRGLMQSGAFNSDKMLTLTPLTWGPEYHKARQSAESGEMEVTDYETFRIISPVVIAASIGMDIPKHPDLWAGETVRLLDAGYLKREPEQKKRAGSVYPAEHPEGLLCRPCDVCGYKYGSEWQYVEVPHDVLEWLKGLPDALDEMPSAWRR